jgi:hypothetical protein
MTTAVPNRHGLDRHGKNEGEIESLVAPHRALGDRAVHPQHTLVDSQNVDVGELVLDIAFLLILEMAPADQNRHEQRLHRVN